MSTSKRLYDARPSNIRPFMDRMKLHISELDLPNVRIQQSGTFSYSNLEYANLSIISTLCHLHIFTAEAVAIYRAPSIHRLLTMPPVSTASTDSMSVLEALANFHDQAAIQWNHRQRARDNAAKSATTHLPLAVPLSDMKRVIMHHIFNLWQESWSQQLDNKLHSVKPVIGSWLDANAKN
ncbi:hypothetical protein TNCV_727191 [Trichonephila clavipes]|nr:hypothetical protein TNCV_727191 [Trichonephila clavipes]